MSTLHLVKASESEHQERNSISLWASKWQFLTCGPGWFLPCLYGVDVQVWTCQLSLDMHWPGMYTYTHTHANKTDWRSWKSGRWEEEGARWTFLCFITSTWMVWAPAQAPRHLGFRYSLPEVGEGGWTCISPTSQFSALNTMPQVTDYLGPTSSLPMKLNYCPLYLTVSRESGWRAVQ